MRKVRYRYVDISAGYQGPQVQVQITPLAWGLAACWGRDKLGLRIGPIGVVLWFRLGPFQRICESKAIRR